MKIQNLAIENFRGIRDVSLRNLGSMVIIAGQNGSGKSCIFDAIRLLKSVYGGYQANEWHHWMGEFQISLTNRSTDFLPIFNNPSKPLKISCEFKISEEERRYIAENTDELVREKIWRTILPEAYGWGGLRMAMFAAQFRDREPEVAARAAEEKKILQGELASPTITGEFNILPGGTPTIRNSILLSAIFSTFRPTEIGVIDYHGAQRHYNRENVQGINLSVEVSEQQRSQSALYNYSSKYTNVKGEMAASYIKEVLAEQAGIPRASQSTLTNTLKELFSTFFPEKTFLGPQPTKDGALTFPVQTANGSTHDLDDLSAGEKEILYGYLRIRNSAPKNSIILLDEPELHLNPRLIRGLPEFYRKHLGHALGNQIWLITHSDALLREVMGRESYNVFHMLPATSHIDTSSQLKPLSATADLELALIDLVGDLASYRPGGKVVIFEGGGDSDFDQKVVTMLFPELQEQTNTISGTNKVRVRALQETLQAAASKGQLPFKFYSVTDLDSEPNSEKGTAHSYTWDVYHIENYFLIPKYIGMVIEALGLSQTMSEDHIWEELRGCAQDCMNQLVRHELSFYANQSLIRCITIGSDPREVDISAGLMASIESSNRRISDVLEKNLSATSLKSKESELIEKYTSALGSGDWVKSFRGRDILKRFCGKHGNGISYEAFRNLILSKMKDDNYKPSGMAEIVSSILSS